MTDGTYRYMRNGSDAGVLSERLSHTAVDVCESTNLLAPAHVLAPDETSVLAALSRAMDAL